MKIMLFTLITTTLLFAADAVVVKKKENPQTNKHAKITASIEAAIAQKEEKRRKNAKLREEELQRIDAALKEKAKIRKEES